LKDSLRLDLDEMVDGMAIKKSFPNAGLTSPTGKSPSSIYGGIYAAVVASANPNGVQSSSNSNNNNSNKSKIYDEDDSAFNMDNEKKTQQDPTYFIHDLDSDEEGEESSEGESVPILFGVSKNNSNNNNNAKKLEPLGSQSPFSQQDYSGKLTSHL
jgi:hypothetical protein